MAMLTPDTVVTTHGANRGRVGRASVSVAERRWSWIWLLVGTILLPFANLQTLIPVTAWLAPVFLLRFSRSQRPLVGLPVLIVAMWGALLFGLGTASSPSPTGRGTTCSSPRSHSVVRCRSRSTAGCRRGWAASPDAGVPGRGDDDGVARHDRQSVRHRWQHGVLAVRVPAAGAAGVRHRDLGSDVPDQLAGTRGEPVLGEGLVRRRRVRLRRCSWSPPSPRRCSSAGRGSPSRRRRPRRCALRHWHLTGSCPSWPTLHLTSPPDDQAERATARDEHFAPVLDDLFDRSEREALAGAKIIAWSEAAARTLEEDQAARGRASRRPGPRARASTCRSR